MILIFSPHPALERVALVDKFKAGEQQRPMKVTTYAGGAAIRAANVVRLLGGDVLVVGFVGGQIGALLRDNLDKQDIPHVLTATAAGTPGSFLVLDREQGIVTEIPEVAQEYTEAESEKLLSSFARHLAGSRYALLADRTEDEQNLALLTSALAKAKESEVPILADVRGAAIEAAAKSGAWLLRMDLVGLQKTTENSVQHDSGIVAEAKRLQELGAVNVCVTLGDEGALLITPTEVWRIKPPVVSHFNATGSGEALMGGIAAFLDKYEDNTTAQEALVTAVRYGSAAASVNVTHDEPGYATVGETNILWPKTAVQRITVRA